MEDKFTIKSAFAMGQPDPKYGQTWYATVLEMDYPVMFNLMSGSVQEGDEVTYETQEINKFKSGKNQGKEYRRLKKVKVRETNPREVTVEAVETNALEERVAKLEAAVFGAKEDKIRETAQEVKDEVAEVGDEPISLDDIPF